MTTTIDPINRQGVGGCCDEVIVTHPEHRMTPAQAVEHAAWLVVMAQTAAHLAGHDQDLPAFDDVLEAVRNT